MRLTGKRIAILVEEMYEDPELWYPYYRLQEEGALVRLVGPEKKAYDSKHGYPAPADVAARDVNADDFDAVVVPAALRRTACGATKSVGPGARRVRQGRRGGCICHAGWVPISAGILRGKRGHLRGRHQGRHDQRRGVYFDLPVVVDGTW